MDRESTPGASPQTVSPSVATPEDCVDWVERAGIGFWESRDSLPSLADATGWGSETIFRTWFWKDDLHIEKQIAFGQYWGDATAFVAISLLPALIASQGDIDPETLFEQGRISPTARNLYRHVERHGPTAKNALPFPAKSARTPPLCQLQRTFLWTKVGLTGRTRGTYGYIWGMAYEFWPEAFDAAARLSVTDARARVVERLQMSAPTLSRVTIARRLHWPDDTASPNTQRPGLDTHP